MYEYEVVASHRYADTYHVECERRLTEREISELLYEEHGSFDEDGRLIGDRVLPLGKLEYELDSRFPGLVVLHVRNDTVGSEIVEITDPLADEDDDENGDGG